MFFSFITITPNKYKNNGWAEPIIGALMLAVRSIAIKNKPIFTNNARESSINGITSLLAILFHVFIDNGTKSNPAKKKRIKASVKG